MGTLPTGQRLPSVRNENQIIPNVPCRLTEPPASRPAGGELDGVDGRGESRRIAGAGVHVNGGVKRSSRQCGAGQSGPYRARSKTMGIMTVRVRTRGETGPVNLIE